MPAQLDIWVLESGKTVHSIPWLDTATSFGLQMRKAKGYALFRYHCNKGCRMNYASSCVLWLGFLVGQAEGCIQQWPEL